MNSFEYVLVVEDDPDMADVMVLALSEYGFPARRAGNGRQALDEVADLIPGLILLDMLMPVMDGWTCARELRARYGRAIPIIIVTAAEDARARAEEVDADGVLPKPFEVDDLVGLAAHYLNSDAAGD